MSIQSEVTRLSGAKSSIATAIENKGVTVPSGTKLDGMPALINSISTGTDTSDATLTSGGQMLSGVTAYAKGSKYTGTIATKNSSDLSASEATVTVPSGYYASQVTKSVTTTTHPAPTATVNSSTGLVTASHTQTAGYVAAGTTTGTLQLTLYDGSTVVTASNSSVV